MTTYKPALKDFSKYTQQKVKNHPELINLSALWNNYRLSYFRC
jgi:hypothetical protein